MDLTQAQVEAFKAPSSRKIMVATLAFGAKAGDFAGDRHIAEFSDVVRCSTHPEVYIEDSIGRNLPFWPTLSAWPDYERAWSPERRIAETATARIQVSRDAQIPDPDDLMDKPVAGYARLDMLTDGDDLSSAMQLCSGPFSLERQDRRTSGAIFSMTDGNLNQNDAATAGKIDGDEFPESPVAVRGVADRQLVLDVYPAALPLVQIDAEGLVFYAHDGVAAAGPTSVRRGQTLVTASFRVRTRFTAITATPYTVVEFSESPWNTPDSGLLTCSGGRGIDTPSPALTLLEDFGGYRLTARARYALRSMAIQQNVLIRQPAGILALAEKRLLPQTDGILMWRNGMLDVLRFSQPAGEFHLGIGLGLRSRYPMDNGSSTADGSIFNQVEIEYGSNAGTGAGGSPKITIGPDSGGAIGKLCAASVARWGLRRLPMVCRDLANRADVVLLGESTLQATAWKHGLHRYSCQWLQGMMLDLNSRVLLTDEAERLDELLTRVVRWKPAATGPQVVLQTEDTNAA